MTTRTRSLLTGLLLLAALTACSADDGSSGITAEEAMDQQAAGTAEGAGTADVVVEADGTVREVAGSAADGQQVVQTARATLLAPDPVAAARDVVALVVRLEGRVDGRYERSGTGPDDPGTATLTLRVPSAAMPTLSDDLGEIADVRELTVETENVTTAAQDLDARITATELSVARMADLLARASSSSEIIEAEGALTERQANLERLRSERVRLADRVALSTVDVAIYAPERAPEPQPDPGPPTFLDGLETGWAGFVATVRTFLHVVGVLLPWLVVAGLAGAAVLVWRRRRAAVPLPPADASPVEPATRP